MIPIPRLILRVQFFATVLSSWCAIANAEALGGGAPTAGASGTMELTDQERKAQAKSNYQRGVSLYAAGDLLESLAAFERAYALVPHHTVLFNIGQIRGKLGRPVEAVRTLKQFLDQGTNQVDETLRRQAQQAIRVNEQRIGRLQIAVEPADTLVLIDGIPWDSAAPEVPLALGPHVLVATREGYVPKTERLELLGRGTRVIQLRLQALAQSAKPVGWLVARCSVPGTTITLDDLPPIRMSRSEHFRVEAGVRRIRFDRSGYAQTSHEVLVAAEGVATADCGLRRLEDPSGADLAGLIVSAPPDLQVAVDEEPFRGGVLPAGPHHVKLLRGKQVVWERDIELAVGENRTISPPLSFQPAESSQTVRHPGRTFAYIAGSIGLASIAGGAVLLAVGAHRYSSWEKERDELAAGQSANTSWGEAVTHAAEIQRIEGLGVGLGMAGIGLVAAAVYSLASKGSQSARTVYATSPQRATFALSGTF